MSSVRIFCPIPKNSIFSVTAKKSARNPLSFCVIQESVVTLSKGEVDSTVITVDFSLEEFDIASIVSDPTYGKIKEYVLEHTGLKVSSAYIAQIKRKCGLEVCECYNKPTSENSRTYICPPEKEQAIWMRFDTLG